MSLRIVYGRSGTGKSAFCLEEIAKKVNSDEQIYIISPEQFSYTQEKKLLEATIQKSILNVEVLNFNRMTYKIDQELGKKQEPNLSNAGKAMIIKQSINKEKNNLKFLNKANSNEEIVLKTITEFKKHCIENLNPILEKVEDDYLKLKLEDINKIYTKYQKHIENKYIDEDDLLTILAKKISKSKMFKNSLVYIDEFAGFTKQEYNLISEILKLAKEVTITICTNDLLKNTKLENDIFYYNKKTFEKLIQIANDENIEIKETVFLNKTYRYKTPELKHIEKNLYKIPYEKYNNKIENIELFLANNPYTEIENIAIKITNLVKKERYRYKDIAIITSNIDEYKNIAKAIFEKYDIPIFIDEKVALNKNILVKYILSLMEIFTKNWSLDSMFNYIKCGFLDISKQDVYKLENIAIKYNIKGIKWQNKLPKEEENLNKLRETIVNPLMEFKNNLRGIKTAEEITKQIYLFLEKNKITAKLEKKIKILETEKEEEIVNEYKKSYEIIIDLLDEIIMIFQNDKITLEQYIELFKTGIKFSKLGKIPEKIDQVILGDISRTKNHIAQAVFLIGINDGMFSNFNRHEGFLNDKDRENLKNINFEIAKGTLENIYEDQFNIYKALTIAENKIYFSYLSTDSEGASLRPAPLIFKIKKIFPNIKEDSDVINRKSYITNQKATFDEMLLNIKKYDEEEEIDSIWFEVLKWYLNDDKWKEKTKDSLKGLDYNNIPNKISNENIKKLYGDKLQTSISKLEQYRKCPFSFYLKYGLGIKEKEIYEIKSIDTGTFMHEIIEEFFKTINEKGYNIKEIEEKEIKEILDLIIEEKLNLDKNYMFTISPKFKTLTNKLKKLIFQALKHIIDQIKTSDFSIKENEFEFEEELDGIKIKGKIDRIDIAKTKIGKVIRIIDYKSSKKDIDLNEVIEGLQIQLLIYSDIISKKENAINGGAFYFNLINPIIQTDKIISKEEIAEKIKKEFRLNGIILANIDIIHMMDNDLENSKSSNIIPVKLNKGGKIIQAFSKTFTNEEYILIQKKIKENIKKISKEMLDGNIDIKPIYYNKNTACKYCEYKSICRFNLNDNDYSYIEKQKKEEIFKKLKEEL